MLALIWGVFAWLRSFIRSRHDLGLEIVALRQQLIVLKRRTKRAHLRRSDRLFWVLLRRAWPLWASPLLIVNPDTVVRWHRKGFRLYWRFRSRSKLVGRPVTGPGGSDFPPYHGEREPDLGSSPHPRRTFEARVRDFRANRLAIPCAVASPRRGCSTMANLPEEPPSAWISNGTATFSS